MDITLLYNKAEIQAEKLVCNINNTMVKVHRKRVGKTF